MSNISKMRNAADLLYDIGKYEDAFSIYDEIYSQIWTALGTVQSGLSEFSQIYLNKNFRASIDFKNAYISQAAESIFSKWFNLDLDQTLNEFTFTTYGRLQCICYSQNPLFDVPAESVFNEFLILYNLILYSGNDNWVNNLFKISTPMIHDNRFSKIRPNYPEKSVLKMLIIGAEKIKSTDWHSVNLSILDFLVKNGNVDSDIYQSINKIVGRYSSAGERARHKGKEQAEADGKKEKKKEYKRYENYERYERYEKYEKYEKHTKEERWFNSKFATDFEKAKYYGQLLGLKGQLTKAQIRKIYLDTVSLYHPDRVHELGSELIELAERKTKEINEAYEWFKKKYNI